MSSVGKVSFTQSVLLFAGFVKEVNLLILNINNKIRGDSVLLSVGGNKIQAVQILGIDRKTLRAKLLRVD